MEREINIKHLFYEVVRCWKQLVIAGIISALLLGGVNLLRANSGAIQNPDYCTYGVLRVIVENGTALKDYSSENRGIMLSDDSMERAASGVENLTTEELRNSVYISYGQYGEIMTVSVITDDQDRSTLLCKRIIRQAETELEENNRDVTVLQSATVRGPVTVSKYENPSNPRDTSDVISDVSAASGKGVGVLGLMKWVLFGAVLGAALWAIVLCIKFIAQGYVKYPEQLDGISPLLNGENTAQTYMNIFLNGQERQTVYFHSLRPQRVSRLVYDLSRFGKTVGEKTLVIEFTHSGEMNAPSYKNNVMQINELFGFDKKKMEELLEGLKREYKRVLIYYDGSCQLSSGIAAGAYADGTVAVVQKGKLKEREIDAAVQQIQAADMRFLGSVFINYENRKTEAHNK